MSQAQVSIDAPTGPLSDAELALIDRYYLLQR
jgi:hypothetical protein